MQISHIDHLVLTVADLDRACDFYTRVLGFSRVDAPGKPIALHFGTCKLNVQQADNTFEPRAAQPTKGSGDFCLITTTPVEQTLATLREHGVAIEAGPMEREGAQGAMTSVYLRDPDRNLVEISRYHSA